MQEFSTHAIRHEFVIDGKTYWLPGITIGDLEAADQVQRIEDNKERIVAFGNLIASRVRPWWRGRRAARRLNIVQITALWNGWIGVPGEAQSSSHGSSEPTAPSSPSTSEPSTTPVSTTSEDTNSQH